MGRKVRKTLNIDAAKLKRVQAYLGVDTETEAIDRALDAFDYERALGDLLGRAAPSFSGFASPVASRPRRQRKSP